MPTRREAAHLAILAITMVALPYGLLFWAEQRIPPSLTAAIFSCLPLATAALTPVVTGAAVPRRSLFALIVASVALVGIFAGAVKGTPEQVSAIAAVIGAVLSVAWASLQAKKKTSLVHPVVSAGWQFAIASLILFACGTLFERGQTVHWSASTISALGLLVLFGSVGGFSLYYWLLRSMEPFQLGSVQLVVPIIAIAEGALLGHEAIPFTIVAAAGCILACVFVVISADQKDEAMVSIAVTE